MRRQYARKHLMLIAEIYSPWDTILERVVPAFTISTLSSQGLLVVRIHDDL